MFERFRSKNVDVLEAKVEAIGRSQAMIEFEPDGTILTANQNFLDAMGYSLEEVRGRHHSMFVEPAERDGAAYVDFWARLRHGEFQAMIYRRIAKGGRSVWIQAAYNPILDRNGKVTRIVKVATDITEQHRRNIDSEGQLAAIGKSQAVIEFALDGTILSANGNFLAAMGYSLEEVRGRHHSMFVTPAERDGVAYRDFWDRLRRGEFQSAEYKRIGKGGREVWIQASYNPILDYDGTLLKVVKFATDITAVKLRNADYEGQIAAIGRSQAVIEFALDGTILNANENFLAAMGFTLEEIRGRNHSMFVAPEERDGVAYREFWERLRRGEFQSAEYKRIGKGGREVWIQASYNPILDLDGKPSRVMKFATDVTDQVLARLRAEHVGQLIESVAAGAEQLNVSVQEISSSMVKSKDTTSSAFEQVMATDRATQQLAEAAEAMGGVVDVIKKITGQINLLALNATIESARAGDAGKGFAVVANEVKNLANQARAATEQISESIDGMRSISSSVVGSLDTIRGSMEKVLEYVTSTATAVEEQSAVANDMSSNMQRAATEASGIGRAA